MRCSCERLHTARPPDRLLDVQAECYDYLFEAAVRMRGLGSDASLPPAGGPMHSHMRRTCDLHGHPSQPRSGAQAAAELVSALLAGSHPAAHDELPSLAVPRARLLSGSVPPPLHPGTAAAARDSIPTAAGDLRSGEQVRVHPRSGNWRSPSARLWSWTSRAQ